MMYELKNTAAFQGCELSWPLSFNPLTKELRKCRMIVMGKKVNGHMPEQKEAKEVIWVIGTSLSHSASRDCAEVYDLKQALFFCNSLTQQLQKLVLFGIF